MKIKIIKKTDDELKIELEGSSHGLCNLLQKKLLEDDEVELAGYDVPHPLASNPTIYVRMNSGAKPQDALVRATQKVRETNDAFGKELDRVLKA